MRRRRLSYTFQATDTIRDNAVGAARNLGLAFVVVGRYFGHPLSGWRATLSGFSPSGSDSFMPGVR
jgi:hypothetical protein